MERQLLFLHGAGTANKNRYDYIFEELSKLGVKTFAFNFSGHDGVDLESSSIAKRYKEAKEEIKEFRLQEPLNLMGSSMGAYISLKLSEEFDVKNLILFCPAMYSTELFNIPFGPEFTKIIRDGESWKDSDAFSIAQKFKGNVIFFTGDKEDVVPKELTKMLKESFSQAESKKVIVLPDATHALGPYIRARVDLTKKVAQEIYSTLL